MQSASVAQTRYPVAPHDSSQAGIRSGRPEHRCSGCHWSFPRSCLRQHHQGEPRVRPDWSRRHWSFPRSCLRQHHQGEPRVRPDWSRHPNRPPSL
jgi:hypothetical protein